MGRNRAILILLLLSAAAFPYTPTYMDGSFDRDGQRIDGVLYRYDDDTGFRARIPVARVYVISFNNTPPLSPYDPAVLCKALTDEGGEFSAQINAGEATVCTQYTLRYCGTPATEEELADCLSILINDGDDNAMYAEFIDDNQVSCCPGANCAPPMPYDNYGNSGTELQYCPAVSANPTLSLCWPIFLILGLLMGAAYASGKNPLSFIDFGAPRPSRGRQYQMRTIGVFLDPLGYVGAADRASSFAKNIQAAKKEREARELDAEADRETDPDKKQALKDAAANKRTEAQTLRQQAKYGQGVVYDRLAVWGRAITRPLGFGKLAAWVEKTFRMGGGGRGAPSGSPLTGPGHSLAPAAPTGGMAPMADTGHASVHLINLIRSVLSPWRGRGSIAGRAEAKAKYREAKEKLKELQAETDRGRKFALLREAAALRDQARVLKYESREFRPFRLFVSAFGQSMFNLARGLVGMYLDQMLMNFRYQLPYFMQGGISAAWGNLSRFTLPQVKRDMKKWGGVFSTKDQNGNEVYARQTSLAPGVTQDEFAELRDSGKLSLDGKGNIIETATGRIVAEGKRIGSADIALHIAAEQSAAMIFHQAQRRAAKKMEDYEKAQQKMREKGWEIAGLRQEISDSGSQRKFDSALSDMQNGTDVQARERGERDAVMVFVQSLAKRDGKLVRETAMGVLELAKSGLFASRLGTADLEVLADPNADIDRIARVLAKTPAGTAYAYAAMRGREWGYTVSALGTAGGMAASRAENNPLAQGFAAQKDAEKKRDELERIEARIAELPAGSAERERLEIRANALRSDITTLTGFASHCDDIHRSQAADEGIHLRLATELSSGKSPQELSAETQKNAILKAAENPALGYVALQNIADNFAERAKYEEGAGREKLLRDSQLYSQAAEEWKAQAGLALPGMPISSQDAATALGYAVPPGQQKDLFDFISSKDTEANKGYMAANVLQAMQQLAQTAGDQKAGEEASFGFLTLNPSLAMQHANARAAYNGLSLALYQTGALGPNEEWRPLEIEPGQPLPDAGDFERCRKALLEVHASLNEGERRAVAEVMRLYSEKSEEERKDFNFNSALREAQPHLFGLPSEVTGRVAEESTPKATMAELLLSGLCMVREPEQSGDAGASALSAFLSMRSVVAADETMDERLRRLQWQIDSADSNAERAAAQRAYDKAEIEQKAQKQHLAEAETLASRMIAQEREFRAGEQMPLQTKAHEVSTLALSTSISAVATEAELEARGRPQEAVSQAMAMRDLSADVSEAVQKISSMPAPKNAAEEAAMMLSLERLHGIALSLEWMGQEYEKEATPMTGKEWLESLAGAGWGSNAPFAQTYELATSAIRARAAPGEFSKSLEGLRVETEQAVRLNETLMQKVPEINAAAKSFAASYSQPPKDEQQPETPKATEAQRDLSMLAGEQGQQELSAMLARTYGELGILSAHEGRRYGQGIERLDGLLSSMKSGSVSQDVQSSILQLADIWSLQEGERQGALLEFSKPKRPKTKGQ